MISVWQITYFQMSISVPLFSDGSLARKMTIYDLCAMFNTNIAFKLHTDCIVSNAYSEKQLLCDYTLYLGICLSYLASLLGYHFKTAGVNLCLRHLGWSRVDFPLYIDRCLQFHSETLEERLVNWAYCL